MVDDSTLKQSQRGLPDAPRILNTSSEKLEFSITFCRLSRTLYFTLQVKEYREEFTSKVWLLRLSRYIF